MNSTSTQVTAGLGGFIVLFLLAVVIVFLARDMSRRIRRLSLEQEDEWLGPDGKVVRKEASDDAARGGSVDHE